MTEYAVSVPEEIEDELSKSFASGRIIEFTEQGEYVELKKVQVDRLGGLKIEIFSNEHPPPHFRVKFQGSTANYSISDCQRINGSGEVVRFENNIYKWWKSNKRKLIDIWNERRPSDCPVGEYREATT
ncbi:DUF4160 domain-containing protein [Thioclava sp. F36-6]|uniref:DUF4160 domain-containing protein n=1 Tax=Thioclava sp. F36-6 TaxID=1915316 RepID=UPI000996CD11|nr:DUF4160 domain-containing protein [Thioclava sp. F36-6]OOY31258.1 hypothetical protein BMI88_09055 [Thioclava sp. F36-6]